ncbi:SI [Branchiostoma lanceolatum]|uniref:SI protein n=1 Tax=Branchiostoma lanceolatum TaxID=7740 RepID=A0A8J9Z275_BRALA|nr:SI [Branchiostoma lanceolatum]
MKPLCTLPFSNTTTVSAYFPDTPWYDYYTGQEVEGEYRGQTVTLDAPLNKINVNVRGGTILPTQQPANTTVYSRKNPMGLLVAMDDSSAASGTLFWDDGEAVDAIEQRDYLLVNFSASSTELVCDVVALPLGGPTAGHWAALRYGTVSVYGLALGTGTQTVRAGPARRRNLEAKSCRGETRGDKSATRPERRARARLSARPGYANVISGPSSGKAPISASKRAPKGRDEPQSRTEGAVGNLRILL